MMVDVPLNFIFFGCDYYCDCDYCYFCIYDHFCFCYNKKIVLLFLLMNVLMRMRIMSIVIISYLFVIAFLLWSEHQLVSKKCFFFLPHLDLYAVFCLFVKISKLTYLRMFYKNWSFLCVWDCYHFNSSVFDYLIIYLVIFICRFFLLNYRNQPSVAILQEMISLYICTIIIILYPVYIFST